MSTAERPEAFGHTVFCDDVRVEADGKFTLVGVYPIVMYVHSDFPMQLPKFGMFVTYNERLDSPSAEPAEGLVLLPGETEENPSVRFSLDLSPYRNKPLPDHARDPDMPPVEHVVFHAHLIFTPLNISSPGNMEVYAIRDGVKINLGRLRIIRASAQTPTKTAAEPQEA